jgi:hypothetical protein
VEEQKNLVVGVFEHLGQAEEAISDLWRAGFAHDRVDMATRSQGLTEATPQLELARDAADGAISGAVAGATIGTVAGLAAFAFIPGLGAVIGGGLLAGALGGMALGAAGGTFLGPFIALEMDEEDAHYYAHQIDEGRTVVVVQTTDRVEEARSILRRYGGRERLDRTGVVVPE